MATTKEAQGVAKEETLEKTSRAAPEPAEGLVLEADYEEDRPVSLLAERQREFQRATQGQYVDAEMPAA